MMVSPVAELQMMSQCVCKHMWYLPYGLCRRDENVSCHFGFLVLLER